MELVTHNPFQVAGNSLQPAVSGLHDAGDKLKELHFKVNELFQNIQEARATQFLWWKRNSEELNAALFTPEGSPKSTHKILFDYTIKAVDILQKKHAATQSWFAANVPSAPLKELHLLSITNSTHEAGSDLKNTLNRIEAFKDQAEVYLREVSGENERLNQALKSLKIEYMTDSRLFQICSTAQEAFIEHLEVGSN